LKTAENIGVQPASVGNHPNAACLHPASSIQHLASRIPYLASAILITAIRLYRLTLSPLQTFLFGADAGCRYTPTCSAYALEAIQVHGAVKGSTLAAKRICRCHPWSGCGHDPVPRDSTSVTGRGLQAASTSHCKDTLKRAEARAPKTKLNISTAVW
jgi:putative membrane protein insertion efficiency factor